MKKGTVSYVRSLTPEFYPLPIHGIEEAWVAWECRESNSRWRIHVTGSAMGSSSSSVAAVKYTLQYQACVLWRFIVQSRNKTFIKRVPIPKKTPVAWVGATSMIRAICKYEIWTSMCPESVKERALSWSIQTHETNYLKVFLNQKRVVESSCLWCLPEWGALIRKDSSVDTNQSCAIAQSDGVEQLHQTLVHTRRIRSVKIMYVLDAEELSKGQQMVDDFAWRIRGLNSLDSRR